ncbi:pyrimidine dimer DNA glycosylase/endonuclease V [Actinomyces sp. B33]|nr:pyrimidine dimer DNA glycosylase/endonuclease V [Actinomyces sp. B33]MDC4233475.1 pyrimidine dimer DNA glycosylase/endonuclease V [Actinomyces sp. B33]
MRLWSLDPTVLDRAALVAGWREGLLAQKVLRGATTGYRRHPQLDRFRGEAAAALIAGWLLPLADEADRRGYRFARNLVDAEPAPPGTLTVTRGQLDLETAHLRAKVRVRAPHWLPRLDSVGPHPLFRVVDGPVEPWERASPEE